MQKAVIDTNIFISALISPHSKPSKVVQFALERRIAVFSEQTFSELVDKLHTKKLVKFIPEEKARRVIDELKKLPFYEITEQITECRDPKDNMFLSLAVSAQASYIVSGDDDLLTLHPFRNIAILSPADFLARYSIE